MLRNFAKRGIADNLPPPSSNDQDQVILDNYYTNQPITIALDKALTPSQNAQRYFKRYQKLKEAVKYLTELIEETKATILYLESVETVLNQAGLEIAEIREELIQTGFIRRRQREKNPETQKNQNSIWRVMAKLSSMSVETIFKMRNWPLKWPARRNFWFHAKDIPEVMSSSQEILTHLMKLKQMRPN